jgi:hypothetical protein
VKEIFTFLLGGLGLLIKLLYVQPSKAEEIVFLFKAKQLQPILALAIGVLILIAADLTLRLRRVRLEYLNAIKIYTSFRR